MVSGQTTMEATIDSGQRHGQTAWANQGQTMANLTDEAAPWTIKGMPIETRQKAVNAANADGQTVAQFLAEAVNLLIDKRAGDVVPLRAAPPLTADQITGRMAAVAALQQSIAAHRLATGRGTGRATLRLCMASLEQRLVEAEGEPAASRMKALPARDHLSLLSRDTPDDGAPPVNPPG